MSHIEASEFQRRFASLIIGGRDFPKKHLDRHILLISATLMLEPQRQYSESELNAELSRWAARFGSQMNLDYATLRRYLVDERYIKRDTAGEVYELVTKGLPYTFDRSIETLDLEALIEEERAARDLRKQKYMRKTERSAGKYTE